MSTESSTITMRYDQVHMGVPDPKAGAEWYLKHLDGVPGDHFDRTAFGATRFIFLKNEKATPSQGSSIDHIGMSFRDIAAKITQLESSGAGIKVVQPVREDALYKRAVIQDPWGTKIEMVEDPETLGFHHVLLREPNVGEATTWWQRMFGGERAKLKGKVDALKYGQVWVLLEQASDAPPSAGHSIDHIGFGAKDLNNRATDLKTKGVTFTEEIHPGPSGPQAPLLMGFVKDPWGVKVELLERLAEPQ